MTKHRRTITSMKIWSLGILFVGTTMILTIFEFVALVGVLGIVVRARSGSARALSDTGEIGTFQSTHDSPSHIRRGK
ncbi:MAG: hypothetical protein KGD60_12160 [Candidatus Thorarchaeota archaeon]|nr:hypothetical protein [Candidatus Thorarchaeota archaeon]